MAQKNDEGIKLIQGNYFKDVFDVWKNELGKDKILIASIPFVRNISKYLEGKDSDNYTKLTSILHIKTDTNNFLIKDLEDIYNQIWKVPKNLNGKERKVVDVIFEEADNILDEDTEIINLENKIVLSISIRLLAEEYMINVIEDKDKIKKITKDQTTILFSIVKKENNIGKNEMALLEQVNLMTPENIHINSFMYEPILDLSDEYLKILYLNIKQLLSKGYAEAATEQCKF